jgi:hypothetical protein
LIVRHIENELRVNAPSAPRLLQWRLQALLRPLRKHRSATSIDSSSYRAINNKVERNVIAGWRLKF